MKQQWHSGFDDSSGWGRLIDPVCLFILCQIAGTLWVITPRKAFAPAVAPSAAVEVHRTENAGLTSQKSALEKAIKLGREELSTLALPVQASVTEQDQMTAQIRIEEQQVKELEDKLAELKRKEEELAGKIAALAGPSPALEKESQQLSQELAAMLAEVQRLQADLEQAKSNGGGIGSPRILDTNLSPMWVRLVGNKARPVDDDNYKVTETGLLQGSRLPAQRIAPKTAAETMEEINAANSKLASYLGKINPEKQYLLCLLSGDSFEIFRQIRRMAYKRNIKVGWETSEATDGPLTRTTGKAHGPGEVGK